MSQPDTFVIVDGNSLMHRAFHALPPLSNEDGVFTNAVFGFLSMLFKVIGDEQPRYLAVAFDLHGPTFRHKDYSEYKAGRKPTAPELKPQFDLVRECLTKMGVKILTCPTFEADDILGTFARRCEEAGIPALLVTGDRDSMQLVTETSSVLYTRRGVSDVVRYTPEKVLEDFGVTPAQIPDLKGLMGDASDNIPGVPGIGEKTAVRLLTAYGTLENALDHADADLKGKQREKLLDGRMSGLMSKKIATITRYVPLDDVTLEDCRLGDMTGVLPLFEQLGLKTLASRLSQLSGSHAADHAPDAPQIVWQDELTLADEAAVAAFIAALPEAARVALLMREDGVSLAAENGAQAVVPYAQGLLGGGLDPLCAAKALSPLLTGARPLVLFGAKRLKTELAPWNIAVSAPFDDDQLMQYLLAPQNGKYEAPASAAALMQQTLADERLADRRDEDIGLPRYIRQILRPGVADGHRRIRCQQQHGHRLAHDVAPPDHHRMPAACRNVVSLQQLHHAQRRTGHETGLAAHQFARIHRVKTVHVLFGINQRQYARLIQPLRQRKLHQNPVYALIRVERDNRAFQLLLRAALRQAQDGRANPRAQAGVFLVAHINLAGRVIARHDHREVRRHALFCQRLRALRGVFLPFFCDLPAVNPCQGHQNPSSVDSAKFRDSFFSHRPYHPCRRHSAR